MRRTLAFLAVLLGMPLVLWAADQKSITLPADHDLATLKAGPGMEVAKASCAVCHSTDYIVLQPRGDAKHWQAVVTKMIKVYGAPIAPESEKTVVEYLSSAYAPAR